MIKAFALLSLILLILPVTSAQIARDTTFVPVSSAQAGCPNNGCLVASMASMLASLNDPKIGTNPAPIIKGLLNDLQRTGGTFPYASSDVINAVITFIRVVL